MHKPLTTLALLLLAGCSFSGERTYCDKFNLPANGSEYAACRAYYAKMEAWFGSDLNTCRAKASLSYPDYMYDHARYGSMETIDHFGAIRNSNILIEPDYTRNQSLDNERRRIIAPCMLQQGWNSPDTWQAGRASAKNQPPKF